MDLATWQRPVVHPIWKSRRSPHDSATQCYAIYASVSKLKYIEFYWIYWNLFKMIQRYWMELQWTPHGVLQIGVCWLSTPSAPQPWRLPSQASGISRSPWPSPWGCPSKLQSEASTSAWHLHYICTVMAILAISIHIPQIWANSTGHVSRCFEMLQDASRCCKIVQAPAWRGQCLPLKTRSDSQPAAFGPWPQTISNIHGKSIPVSMRTTPFTLLKT